MKNALRFGDYEGLKTLLERLLENEQVKMWLEAYINREKIKVPLSESVKFKCLGNVLKEEGYTSNGKIVYDLYRLKKSFEDKKDSENYFLTYFREQCEKIFELVGVLNKDNVSISFIENGVKTVAEFCHLEKHSKGRPVGASTKGNLKSDKIMISKYFSKGNKWNETANSMRKELSRHTFSIYSFVEYKELKNSLKLENSSTEILRSLVEFNGEKLILYAKNSSGDIKKHEVDYNITPISGVKMAIKTNDIHLDLNGDPLIAFFFEITNWSFYDFAQGYFRETHINNGFKVGSSILVKEIGGVSEIKEKKVISYEDLDRLPIESLKQYFRCRNQNFLRPPVVDSQKFNDLEVKLKVLKTKPKDVRIYKYDVFISMPILFDNPKEETYNERISYYEALKNLLPNRKLFFAAAGKSLEEYKSEIINQTFDDVIEEIPFAKYFILFIPPFDKKYKENISKSVLELGIAKYLKRNILSLVHIDNENYLPNSKDIDIIQRVFSNAEDLKKIDFGLLLKWYSTTPKP